MSVNFTELGPCTPGDAEWQRRLDLFLADPSADQWWWMVFVDPAKPTGQQFLGLCILAAPNTVAAVQASWVLGCNPGGQVESYPIDRRPRPQYVGRLFTDPLAQAMADDEIDLWEDAP